MTVIETSAGRSQIRPIRTILFR